MQQFAEFFLNHIVLFTLLFIILGLLAWSYLGDRLTGVTTVDHAELTRLVNRQDAALLDIRSEAEFEKGHILGAKPVPEATLDNGISAIKSAKDHPIVVYCATGMSAPKACRKLKKAGYGRVYALKGGVNAWTGASLPLAKE